jgi:PAS domain S-box-containing protein
MPMQWEKLFDDIGEGFIALDRAGAFLYANGAGAAVFGSRPQALKGRPIDEFTRSEATAGLAGIIVHCLESDSHAELDAYNPATQRWYQVRSHPVSSGLTVFLHDITDKKRAQDSLRLSEAKFAGIVNISADAIISIDTDQKIIHFNNGAEEIFGWTATEMIGQKLDALLPERFRPGHAQHIRNFAASPVDARRMGERRTIAGLRRNGEEFPAEASISKISVGDQRVFTVVLRDASERQQREETYRRLYEEAQRAVAARDDVLSFVSHDLGNPLAAIRIATAVLLKRVQPDDPDSKHVFGIREAVEQAQRLIRDLLDVQKAEAGKLVLHFEEIDLGRLIEEAIKPLQQQIEEKRINIVRDVANSLRRPLADPARVGQVLTNLIGNAVKFSPAGGRVYIAAQTDGQELIVSVRDEGPGIPSEELPHVFDRYWQAKTTGKVGHGIGLSIVQALTKAHEGRVWAESTVGEGSTFWFSLPIGSRHNAEALQSDHAAPAQHSENAAANE